MSESYPAAPKALARLASAVARKAGDRVFELRREGVTVTDLKSSTIDMVTEADRAAEAMIAAALTAERPGDGLIGEEGAGADSTSGITWVIDPIDGTTNYFYDIPAYVVSIAATVPDPSWSAEGTRTIAAAVYNPSTHELFEAWEEGGAFLNGEKISVADRGGLSTALVGTGFGYTVERKLEQLEVAQRLLPKIRDLRRIGAAAYDLCLVACGRLDAYYERGLRHWDYAAGALIAAEAGASLLGIDDATAPGTPLLCAAAPGVVHELRDTITGASN